MTAIQAQPILFSCENNSLSELLFYEEELLSTDVFSPDKHMAHGGADNVSILP